MQKKFFHIELIYDSKNITNINIKLNYPVNEHFNVDKFIKKINSLLTPILTFTDETKIENKNNKLDMYHINNILMNNSNLSKPTKESDKCPKCGAKISIITKGCCNNKRLYYECTGCNYKQIKRVKG